MPAAIRICAGVLIAISGASSALAQNYNADPTNGVAELSAGFSPAPHDVSLQVGGPLDAAQTLGQSCAGFINVAPDYRLMFTAGAASLTISVTSEADTTLVISPPDGEWICDDDSGGNGDPAITWSPASSGQYDIFVGTKSPAQSQATLTIQEGSQ